MHFWTLHCYSGYSSLKAVIDADVGICFHVPLLSTGGRRREVGCYGKDPWWDNAVFVIWVCSRFFVACMVYFIGVLGNSQTKRGLLVNCLWFCLRDEPVNKSVPSFPVLF